MVPFALGVVVGASAAGISWAAFFVYYCAKRESEADDEEDAS